MITCNRDFFNFEEFLSLEKKAIMSEELALLHTVFHWSFVLCNARCGVPIRKCINYPSFVGDVTLQSTTCSRSRQAYCMLTYSAVVGSITTTKAGRRLLRTNQSSAVCRKTPKIVLMYFSGVDAQYSRHLSKMVIVEN